MKIKCKEQKKYPWATPDLLEFCFHIKKKRKIKNSFIDSQGQVN